jgi:hypothetical protein
MIDQIKGFVEFRYDHLTRKKIVRSYNMILILNILLFVIVVLNRDYIIFMALPVILIIYFIVVNKIIFTVKKLMMRTYLFMGATSVYSGLLLAAISYYYLVKGLNDHNIPMMLMIIAVMIIGNIMNYLIIKKNIENGKFLEKSKKNEWTTGKALILIGGLVIGRIVTQSIRYLELDKIYPGTYYWLKIFAIFGFLFIISAHNMILLKAYYINKYNMEKDECKYINLAERLG